MIFFSIKHNACLINMTIEWLWGWTSIWHNLWRFKRQFMFGMDCNSQHTFKNSFLSTCWKHLIWNNWNKGHMCVFLIVWEFNLKSVTHQFKDMSGLNTCSTTMFTPGHTILKKGWEGLWSMQAWLTGNKYEACTVCADDCDLHQGRKTMLSAFNFAILFPVFLLLWNILLLVSLNTSGTLPCASVWKQWWRTRTLC